MYREIDPRPALLWSGRDSEIKSLEVDVIGEDPDRRLMRVRHVGSDLEHNVNPDGIELLHGRER